MTAQTDTVDRLRAGVGLAVGPWPEAIHEAADEIERLLAENERLREENRRLNLEILALIDKEVG